MKRGRTYTTKKVNVAKRQKRFAAATKSKTVVVGYQAGRAMSAQPGQELKAFDVAATTVASQTTAGGPTFTTLNAMTNGAELYQRVGRKVYMKSLHFRATLAPNGVASEGQQRMIIFYDSNPAGAVPAIADLIQDSTAGAATSSYSEINLTNRERFQIIRDIQWLTGQSTNIAGATQIVPDPIKESLNIDLFLPLKGLETVYNGVGGGLITSITAGALNFVIFGDANAAGYSLTFHSRVRYYD